MQSHGLADCASLPLWSYTPKVDQVELFFPSTEQWWGFAPSFSSHVRLGERGAPALCVKVRGIPHLAKNERDVGHPGPTGTEKSHLVGCLAGGHGFELRSGCLVGQRYALGQARFGLPTQLLHAAHVEQLLWGSIGL
jgi:hypothetical protein